MILIWMMTINNKVRLSTHFGQINAPKSNDKVEINAGDYIIRCRFIRLIKEKRRRTNYNTMYIL